MRRLCFTLLCALASCARRETPPAPEPPPHILWIVAEDMNLEIGAYGDPLAETPNIDRLAAEGVRYTHAFATAPTCAPSRASLITGMYATSIGAQHMRSSERDYRPVPPPYVKTFPEMLRMQGYYAANDTKLDYQFSGVLAGAPVTNWDEEFAGDFARRLEGQPFFFYSTIMRTHEGQLFAEGPTVTDPASVTVPPYYPDTPLVRTDLARHYDNVARMDEAVGELLDRLDAEGLTDDTVVVFFADNGRGLPRDKRWVYDGGIHEPLIVRWPGHIEPGTVNDELVSFIDLAPTMLSVAGVPVPEHMPGRVLFGDHAEPPPDYVFAAADRMDEATDRIRAVRDHRFKYIRNYMPELPYGQTVVYRERLATMGEIHRLQGEGLLVAPADWYYRATKPVEELYDVLADPFEVNDLAGDSAYADVLSRMREAHFGWVSAHGDMSEVSETVLAERFWPGGVAPVTPAPTFVPARMGGGRVAVTIEGVEGASIAYFVEGSGSLAVRVYSAPVVLRRGESLNAVAVRYGWLQSEASVFAH